MATPAGGTTAAVVLAAGGGTRFAGPTHKLLAPVGGRPLVAVAVARAVEAGFDEVLVVQGAVELPPLPGTRLVRNERWADGIATSLRSGVDAAAAGGHGAVVVGLGDQPGIPAEAWRLVSAALDTPIAVATYGGRRGNPVRLAAAVWSELPEHGDEGARVLFARRPEWVGEVPCPGSADDVDTLEDLAPWSS